MVSSQTTVVLSVFNVIPHSWVVGGSDTGNISPDKVCEDRFSCLTMSNFEQERRYVHMNNAIKKGNEISQTNDN